MTKKHFQALADALRSCEPDLPLDTEQTPQIQVWRQWHLTCREIADVCAQTNPRFDRARFLKACGVED